MSTKVVINRCFGGFGLSEDAQKEYLRRKGLKYRTEPSGYQSLPDYIYIEDGTKEGKFFSAYEIERDDPILVEIVEKWGDRANGEYAKLEVEEIATGVMYRIEEYDGNEHIEYKESNNWSVG